jgi:acetyl esterase/lipase
MIWIHGGALIIGDRSWIDRLLWYVYQQAGFVIVSIDYRLAPETKLPDIIQDLRDAYAWVREKGPTLFRIDPTSIAVSGESAGGYLTLMRGFRLTPPPKVLVSFWGYGDIIGNWYSRPDPFYSKVSAVSKEQPTSPRAIG